MRPADLGEEGDRPPLPVLRDHLGQIGKHWQTSRCHQQACPDLAQVRDRRAAVGVDDDDDPPDSCQRWWLPYSLRRAGLHSLRSAGHLVGQGPGSGSPAPVQAGGVCPRCRRIFVLAICPTFQLDERDVLATRTLW